MSESRVFKPAETVQTASVVAFGLVGGFLTGRETGSRPLAGVLLAAAGAYAGRTWAAQGGAGTTVALSALYLGGFGASHPLAKKIGAWPAVLSVAGASALASWALVDRKR